MLPQLPGMGTIPVNSPLASQMAQASAFQPAQAMAPALNLPDAAQQLSALQAMAQSSGGARMPMAPQTPNGGTQPAAPGVGATGTSASSAGALSQPMTLTQLLNSLGQAKANLQQSAPNSVAANVAGIPGNIVSHLSQVPTNLTNAFNRVTGLLGFPPPQSTPAPTSTTGILGGVPY